jgi:hypothetical protein
MRTCNICKTPFDEGLHQDCGGDCLLCMAEAGDTDCALTAVVHLKAQRDALRALVDEALKEYSIGYVLGTDWVERAQSTPQPADPSAPTP